MNEENIAPANGAYLNPIAASYTPNEPTPEGLLGEASNLPGMVEAFLEQRDMIIRDLHGQRARLMAMVHDIDIALGKIDISPVIGGTTPEDMIAARVQATKIQEKFVQTGPVAGARASVVALLKDAPKSEIRIHRFLTHNPGLESAEIAKRLRHSMTLAGVRTALSVGKRRGIFRREPVAGHPSKFVWFAEK